MNVLVTGSSGQLGSEINALASLYKEYHFFFTDVEELDITNEIAISEYVETHKINTIINCAAYTAVDNAESEPEIADKINHIAVKNLSAIAREKSLRLIHISTDYVFNGEGFQPYATDHPTDPVNMYGLTKRKGEEAMREINPPNSLIIRTSWVYSSFGKNFVKTMLRLGSEKDKLTVIADQVGVPTYAKDLAVFILDHALSAANKTVKTYHYTNEGVCSWYDFAIEIMAMGKRSCKVNPIPTANYPTPAKRPFYSLMDKESLKKDFDTEIPYWKDSLRHCIQLLDN
ncbi:MAG: dTDP-4-dehydrorhamnose reductase [Leeuwenhoekiella sp.]